MKYEKTKKKVLMPSTATGAGGETHQRDVDGVDCLTSNQGLIISDDQNSLKGGERGPTLLEDFLLREKITHFDHERIPERIVHARGSAAHGVFTCTKAMGAVTEAGFLAEVGLETPVFARLSTVTGGAGSVDLARDARGFSVKFYTQQGNYDLVGNNIPVFFIQDALKFPDLIHSVKMESDRGYPQSASAHDTFWDFISLMPESMHMVMWVMSDRGIPRSLRMMEGFGVHTFRLVNETGESKFVKFHWRPALGSSAVLWDEAVKICGADQDFHRRDLYEAIESGDYPEWELGLQIFDEKFAESLPYDVLDATKLIPEELVPLEIVGTMVLNRNPDNFFAETEQVAFCPSHLVPGIDFSDDPLLQGRLLSYHDTQLSRLGTVNFHQIPINQPKCPFANMQRDGHMQMQVPKGRANYEPNSIEPNGPRESLEHGYSTFAAPVEGQKVRIRSESFADHYSQARMFYRSVSEPEQKHIGMALAFELGKVEIQAIRKKMLGHLTIVDPALGQIVADRLGMSGEADVLKPLVEPVDLDLSPALSLYHCNVPTLRGRKIGILAGEGFDAQLMSELIEGIKKDGAAAALICLKVGGVKDSKGKKHVAAMALAAAPSVLFDAVTVWSGPTGEAELMASADAQTFLRDAKRHLKTIGFAGTKALAQQCELDGLTGVIEFDQPDSITRFLDFAKRGKIWERETE